MPWSTPTLREVRSLVRDAVNASLPGADANVPNSVLRVMSDNQGALCHLTLQYVDWLSLQLLPDTAETEWLDRHGDIWLVNADGTTGRKMATLATGTASFQGIIDGSMVPAGTQLQSGVGMPAGADSPNQVVSSRRWRTSSPRRSRRLSATIRALDPGSFGNLPTVPRCRWAESGPRRLAPIVTVVHLTGGTDTETDEQLRTRILQRIRNPPMGGSQADYVDMGAGGPRRHAGMGRARARRRHHHRAIPDG